MFLATVCGGLTESGENLELEKGEAESATTAVISPTFRLGSGALVTNSPTLGLATQFWSSEPAKLLPDPPAAMEANRLKSLRGSADSRSLWLPSLRWFLLAGIGLIVMLMMPAAGPPNLTGRENFNYRIPPAWSPEQENTYSFRAYMTDISLWVRLTDLQPHQQCAAIIMRLGGAAREMARMMTPQEMAFGGVRNGVAVDPVTYLLAALHARFASLEEESRLTSMTEMLAFTRRPGETINALLARYETVRQRAAVEGQFTMSVEGCALQILRACGIQSHHLFTLLQPFRGQLPQTDQQFQELCTQLRRFGHISEGTQGNVAAVLHGPMRQARPGSYLTQQDQHAYQAAAHRTASRTGGSQQLLSFYGQEQPNQGPGSPWYELEPQPLSAGPQVDPFTGWQTGGDQFVQHGSTPFGGSQQAEAEGAGDWTSWDYAYPTGAEDMEDITDTDTDTTAWKNYKIQASVTWTRQRQQNTSIGCTDRQREHGDALPANLCGSSAD